MLKVLSLLLFSSNLLAAECQTSEFFYRQKALCFLSQHKAYVTADCVSVKCEALTLIEKAAKVDKTQLGPDSRHVGSKLCSALGGTTAIAEAKNKNQICLCEMPDQSAIACNRLGL